MATVIVQSVNHPVGSSQIAINGTVDGTAVTVRFDGNLPTVATILAAMVAQKRLVVDQVAANVAALQAIVGIPQTV